MTFEFLVAVKIKNDGLTQEADPDFLSSVIGELLLSNAAARLPWVLEQDIKVITRDTRE